MCSERSSGSLNSPGPATAETDEECCSGKHADGRGQPVHAARAIVDYLRGSPVHHTPAVDDKAQTGEIWRQNTAEK